MGGSAKWPAGGQRGGVVGAEASPKASGRAREEVSADGLPQDWRSVCPVRRIYVPTLADGLLFGRPVLALVCLKDPGHSGGHHYPNPEPCRACGATGFVELGTPCLRCRGAGILPESSTSTRKSEVLCRL